MQCNVFGASPAQLTTQSQQDSSANGSAAIDQSQMSSTQCLYDVQSMSWLKLRPNGTIKIYYYYRAMH